MTTETIEDASLDIGDTLALSFARNLKGVTYEGGSTEVMEYDVAFFEVQGREPLIYDRYKLKDDNGDEKGAIDPNAGISFDQLYDDRGRDIARVETNESHWLISHFSLGVLEKDILIYPRVPDVQRRPGWSWANQSEPDPDAGDQFGHVASKETGYNNPSAKLQTFAFESGDNSRMEYGFYNKSNTIPLNPTINIKGYTYRVAPVSNEDRQMDVLRKALSDEESAKIVTWGVISDSFAINLPDDWTDAGCVARISGGVFSDIAEEDE